MPARILVAEDEPLIRTTMSLILAESGYIVRVAENGFSALRAIRDEIPDILLSDLNMPGMSGIELLSEVRRRFPAIALIAMSGAFSGNEVPPGLHADAFYPKGGKAETLLQIIRTIVQREGRDLGPAGAMAPVPIHRNGPDTSSEERVMMACSDCLRTTPQTIDDAIDLIRETECIDCRIPVRYAIA